MGNDRNDRKRPGAALVFAAVIMSLCAGYIGGRGGAPRDAAERTDTLTVRDTVVCYSPVVTEVRTVRTDTVRLAVAQPPDTVFVRDTVEVEVPIVFSRYKGDNYDIGVSGFRTELEYVKVYPETKVVTRSLTTPPRRWGFGVAAGPSVIVTPSGAVRAGFGVTGGFYLRL